MGVRYRVASTLTVLVLIAFVLELLAVLSVPVTKTITLSEYGDYKFGVFGYCNTKTNKCSSVGVGYDVSNVDNKFSLPSNARESLANLLIVHVVAAGLTLILLIFSILAHIHGPANSSRFILFVLVFSIPSFLLTLLAFLVDILLFVSHMSWGGWIMLAATVLLLAALIVLCIMRRTLSSQKAMRKRMNVTSELHDMDEFNNNNPQGDPFSNYSKPSSGRDTTNYYKDGDFSETKYETSSGVDDSTPLNNNSNYPPNNNNRQSFILQDDPPMENQPSTFTDHYQHAANKAYRGGGGGGSGRSANNPTMPSETAATAATNLPTNNQPTSVPQIPAGMNIDEDEDYYDAEYDNRNMQDPSAASSAAAAYPSHNSANYGPNVVPIPKLRNPDAQAGMNNSGQRKPSGPRAYKPQYQHPPQPQYPQRQEAPEYGEPQQAQYYEPEPPSQPQYEEEDMSSGGNHNTYVPPRQQWQHQPQPQQMASPEDLQSPYLAPRYQQQQQYDDDYYYYNPPQPSQSPSNVSDTSHYTNPQYQQPPQPPQHYYQPAKPNRSDMVLQSNPDFQIPPPSRSNKNKRNGGNTNAPSASNASNMQSSSAANNNQSTAAGNSSSNKGPPPGRKKPNMPAAFATSDSPYGISRTAGGGALPPNI